LASGANTGIDSVPFLLSQDSFTFSINRASQGGVAGDLGDALALLLSSVQGGSALGVSSGSVEGVGILGKARVDGAIARSGVGCRRNRAGHGSYAKERRAGAEA
jgi:TRAP-type uncharacterized transport system substrate-binding protein